MSSVAKETIRSPPNVLGFPLLVSTDDTENRSAGSGAVCGAFLSSDFRCCSPAPVSTHAAGGVGRDHLLLSSHSWLLWLIQQLKMKVQRKQSWKSPFISIFSGAVCGSWKWGNGLLQQEFHASACSLPHTTCYSLTAYHCTL